MLELGSRIKLNGRSKYAQDLRLYVICIDIKDIIGYDMVKCFGIWR